MVGNLSGGVSDALTHLVAVETVSNFSKITKIYTYVLTFVDKLKLRL